MGTPTARRFISLDVDGKPARRIVLGDWHREGSVLEWRDDGVELRALPRAEREEGQEG